MILGLIGVFQRRYAKHLLYNVYGGIPDLPQSSELWVDRNYDSTKSYQSSLNRLMHEYVLEKNKELSTLQKNQLIEVFNTKPGYYSPGLLFQKWTNKKDSMGTFVRRQFYTPLGTFDRTDKIVDGRAQIMVQEILDGIYPKYRITHKDSLYKPWGGPDGVEVGEESFKTREIVKKYLAEHPQDVDYMSVDMLDDFDVMEAVVVHETHGDYITCATARVKNDKRIALRGLHYKEGNKVSLGVLGDDIRDDTVMFLMAYCIDPKDAFTHTSNRLRSRFWMLKP